MNKETIEKLEMLKRILINTKYELHQLYLKDSNINLAYDLIELSIKQVNLAQETQNGNRRI